MSKYTFIKEITSIDPDSLNTIDVEIWKDNDSGGIFGIDASFAEQVDIFYNPFNGAREVLSEKLPLSALNYP